jgi:hypothetical protein
VRSKVSGRSGNAGMVAGYAMCSCGLRNELVPISRLESERRAGAGEVKRLGDEPVVIAFQSDQGEVEVAARAEHRSLVTAGTFDSPRPHATAWGSG